MAVRRASASRDAGRSRYPVGQMQHSQRLTKKTDLREITEMPALCDNRNKVCEDPSLLE